ncbi:hypothetical protein K431DRAFT_143903 [Polychaeton citri CBS 116435]|uniref:Uncharacterized protein n=1 Tax=Polychaeton citri CBS 116435 TaxID=1314669 RepID=A0A9P4Q434_9PEZI|nr:hypothetical protein K431DRAFT_143903 [Polychaeton citri CBS 116435]
MLETDVRSGMHLGHGGEYLAPKTVSEVCAETRVRKTWECYTPRQHPRGGYQFLSPHFSDMLLVVCLAQDRKNLERREAGTTL